MKKRAGEVNSVGKLSDYSPQITDFGLAKLIDGSLVDTRSSLMVGTLSYMSPEQIDSIAVGDEDVAATDVYSFGMLLYELLTLAHPFESRTYFETIQAIRSERPKSLAKFKTVAPVAVCTVCLRCLEKNPAHRYKTAADVATDLRNCLSGETISKQDVTIFERALEFASAERRIYEAGWFTMWSQLAIAFWIATIWTAFMSGTMLFDSEAYLLEFQLSEIYETLLHVFVTIVGLALPLAWLGWKVTFKKLWAVWAALIMTLSAYPALILGCVGRPVLFRLLYKNELTFAPTVHSLLFSIHIAQTILLVFAVLAMRKLKKRAALIFAEDFAH